MLPVPMKNPLEMALGSQLLVPSGLPTSNYFGVVTLEQVTESFRVAVISAIKCNSCTENLGGC